MAEKGSLGIYGIQDRGSFDCPNFVHDHALAFFKNGRLVTYLQLERITRKKFDNSLHKELREVLRMENLIGSEGYDLAFVDCVLGRCFLSTDGNVRFEAPLNSSLLSSPERGRCWWFDTEVEAYALNHELAHLFSCIPFYGMFRENSLLFHFDGGASLGNYSFWHFKNGKINLLEYGWELKRLSSFFNANALSFFIVGASRSDQNSVPGKLMGLAAYGEYRKDIEEWLVQNSYFQDIWTNKNYFFEILKKDWNISLTKFDQKHWFIQSIAAVFQHIFSREVVKKIAKVQEKIMADCLYYSGGSALSIVTNSILLEKKLFKDVFIPPCCNDSGLALGAAVALELKKGSEIKRHSAYLNNWGISAYKVAYSGKDIEQIANLLMNGKVIGVCNGMAEIGPRALGNRSILALADSKELAQKVSMFHKKREWYRPVAPIMLEKNARYYTGLDKIHHLSKFMLLDYRILEEKRQELEGVVHVDGSSRIQAVFDSEDNPFIFDLLSYLDEHGIKALINTSFNVRGEPIVHTLDDALKSAKEMKLDALVFNGKVHSPESSGSC